MGKDLREGYDAFNTLWPFENSDKNLRERIATREKPLLPPMGTCSKDLFLAYEDNSSKEHGLYNFNKLRIMFGVISEFSSLQLNEPPPENTDTLPTHQHHFN